MKMKRPIRQKIGFAAVLLGLLTRGVHAEVVSAGPNTPDRWPPRLLETLPPEEVTSHSALLLWTTDEAASTRVEYGLTPDYGFYSAPNPTRVTHHSVRLVHLKSATTYHYRFISTDAAGNTVYSKNYTFTTPSDRQVQVREPAERHAANPSATPTAID